MNFKKVLNVHLTFTEGIQRRVFFIKEIQTLEKSLKLQFLIPNNRRYVVPTYEDH